MGNYADSYHRYPEDIELMKDLGIKAYRFSIAWSRIFPEGRGKPNQKGINHYRRFTEALLKAGIQPYCTLYHWDLPQARHDKGGWESRDTAQAFADYAGYFAGRLSDMISNFMTLNEIANFTDLGYGNGQQAPGLKLGRAGLAQVKHHVMLAHGLSVQAIRANTKPGTRIGSAENVDPVVPVYDAPDHVAAARIAMLEQNAATLGVMYTGKYTDRYLRVLGADAPKFTDADLRAISAPVDFQGLNIYTPTFVRADSGPDGYAVVKDPLSLPKMYSPWLTFGPEALYWAPKLAAEVFGMTSVYITENGCSSSDDVVVDGQVYDTDRVMYLRNYLANLQKAVAEGVPVKGYFLWSLLDNFEWEDGYDKLFGITHVDFATQKRTPKLSSKFYKDIIANNAL